jgi:FKBP-type peptidyl-prolyl cis-trans isomerase
MNIRNVANLGLAVAMVAFTSCNNEKRQASLNSEIDSVSYALGLDISKNIANVFKQANKTAIIQGFKDSADSTAIKITDPSGVLRNFFMKKQQDAMAKAKDSLAVTEEEAVNTNNTANLLTENDSVSYAIGLDISTRLKPTFPDIKDDLFIQAITESADSTKVLLDPKEINNIVNAYFKKQQEAKSVEAKADGLKFLAENKVKEGVVTTESGLQYTVLKEGNSTKPGATDNVTVHYHGTTPDGTVFDSSVDRGEPTSFGLNQVIKGWTEGVQLMGVGAKYKFVIPQELAYGANAPQGGQGPIKNFMPLVFEVELISINK